MLVLQVIVCIILLITILVSHNKLNNESKNKSIIILILTIIFFIIITNIAFVLLKEMVGKAISSVLDYDNAQLMVVSTFVATWIAVLQIRIQQLLNERNCADGEDRKRFHLKEIQSERIKALRIYSYLNAELYNFNIANCKAYYPSYYDMGHNSIAMIKIYNAQGNRQIFPNYFLPNKDNWLEVSIIECDKSLYSFVVNDNRSEINIFFKKSELINQFILSSNKETITVKLEFNGKDTSFSDEDYSEFSFELSFFLKKITQYNERGYLDLLLYNHNIKNTLT